MSNEPLLDWTGHTLVDVGIAALCAMCNRASPVELTLEDLDAAAAEMHRYYFSGVMNSYLTCVFMNSEYVQPGSGTKKDASRKEYSRRVLYAHRWAGDEEGRGLFCVFSGRQATHVVHRGQMPMLTGEGVLNFFPAGLGGLSVAGPYLTAIQALPLGGRRAEGKLLVAHSDDANLTLGFARKYLEDNRRLINLTSANALPEGDGPDPSLEREQASWDAAKKRPKMPDAKAAHTLITCDLMTVLEAREETGEFGARQASVTVYWLSSSGQGPSLYLFEIPGNLVAFLDRARKAETGVVWRRILAAGWPAQGLGKASKKRAKAVHRPGAGITRNAALEELVKIFTGGLPDPYRAERFLRRHVFPTLRGSGDGGSSWLFTVLFLKEILGMHAAQISAIEAFSDRLADHIHRRNPRRFLQAVLYASSAWEFRNALVKEQRNEFLANRELLFTLEDYLKAFAVADGTGEASWSLVRDLISIRLIERLAALGIAAEALPELEATDEETENVEKEPA